MSHPTSTVHHRFQQIGLLLGLLLIVPLIAFTIVQLNGPDLRKQAFDNLNSIVALKVGQIEHWLDERRMDLEFLVAGEGFVSRAEDLILTSNADSRAFVVRRLETYLKSRYYHSAILVNAAGEGVVAIGEHDKITPVMRELLQDALKSGQVTRSDLYRDEASGHIHIEYLVPLPGTGGRLPVAAVVLHALPERFLFPLIQTWPVASASAESLLVRRDGKDVLFLNELRHRQGAAMSLRLPLDRANSLASVAAVLSHSPQTLESLDYRGVAVLAATHPVAGTPWHLVAKIDREEVMVPIKTLIGWVSLVTLAAIITIAWVIEQLRRQMLHSHRLELSAQAQADLQRSEQKFRILSENATDSIFWTAPDGHFLYVSPACKTIFGYEPESFMGYPSLMETLIHPECLDSYRSHMQNLQEKEDTSLEFCFVHRDGHIRWFAHQCRAIYDEKDHFLGRRGSNTDITEKKRLREELDRHRHHLEERVVQRTEELIAARQEAESANRAKSEFLANMSHEIRTPMNAIIGLADLAIKLEMPAKLRDYLAKIAHAAQSLLRIINDILDFSKIEAGKLELELSAFLLREVFDRLGDLFRAQATEKKLELILCLSEECRYELRGDSLRLEQILMNLVSNALKFTEEGEIEVQAKTLQESAHQVTLEFSVRDTGIGMVDGTADQIFLPFTQADTSVTRQFGGTGLGLSISKRLVEMMGGSIWAHSELGRGSVFRFTASFQRNLGVETRDMIPPENMERLKALVVDDNRPARNALRKMLEMFGFSVTGAGSGPEAIEAIQQGVAEGRPYPLVLVDWFMPKMDGLQTLQQVKEGLSPEFFPKTILLIPYNREEKCRLLGDAVGVNAYLAKPVNCSILFDTIMEIFGRDVAKAFRKGKGTLDTQKIVERIGGARVLLAEDNPINQQVAREILEDAGLIVEVANNGLEALARLTESAYDLVLMDIQMPEMDGYQASRRIRSDPGFANLPIIAMTAHAMTGDREKCLAAGMNDHLTKPIDLARLYEALMEWIPAREGLGLAVPPERNQDLEGNSPPIPEMLPETLPGIDLNAALVRLKGNRRLYRSLLLEFHRDYAQSGQQIRFFLVGKRNDDVMSAAKLLHTVKGIAGNIAATRLFDATWALERQLKLFPEEPFLAALDRFESALNEVVAGIGTMKQQEEDALAIREEFPASVEAPPLDREKIIPLMNALSQRLKRKAYETQESFDALKPHLNHAPTGVQEALRRLEELIERLDFKGAQPSLAIIAKILEIDLN